LLYRFSKISTINFNIKRPLRLEAWQSHAGQARNFSKVDSGFSHGLFSNTCRLFGNAGLSGLAILIPYLCAGLALLFYPPGCSFSLSPVPKGPAHECYHQRSNAELRAQDSLLSLLLPDLDPCFPSQNSPAQGIASGKSKLQRERSGAGRFPGAHLTTRLTWRVQDRKGPAGSSAH